MREKKFVIRQKGRYSKYCYYWGFDGGRHRWTKNLRNCLWFDNVNEARMFKTDLKFNCPKVIGININGAGKIKSCFNVAQTNLRQEK